MKTLKKILFFVFGVLFLVACSKSDREGFGFYGMPGDNFKGKPVSCGEFFVVEPNGTDDTENLQKAFNDAIASGPGSTVQLTKGQYTIGFIAVRDFKGFFKGAGKGKTVIGNKSGLQCDAEWEKNALPGLIKFIGGDIMISHMTFRLNDGEPCQRGPLNDAIYGDLCSILILADYSSVYVPDNRFIKGSIDNVEFIAGDDGGYGTYGTEGNVAMGLYCGSDKMFPDDFMPLTTGEFSITNCYFENGLCGPDIWALDEKSMLNIENTTMNKNCQQLFLGALMGTKVNIRNNKFLNGTYVDLFIMADDWGYYPGLLPLKPTRYTIKGNYFQSPAGVSSLYMKDSYRIDNPAEVFPQIFDISNNVFITKEGIAPFPNLYGLGEGGMAIQALDLKDAVIWNNKFLGSGKLGVLIDGDETTGTYSENAKLSGNNFFDADYTDASVYLGAYSRYCKVFGVSKDKVINEGVDNVITAAKALKPDSHLHQYNHPGPAQRHLFVR